MKSRNVRRPALPALAVALLSGCATPFTGPVEVTRFVAPDSAALTRAPIEVLVFDTIEEEALKAEVLTAVAAQLGALGYGAFTGPESGEPGALTQVAEVGFSQSAVASADRRGPVSVGVGGSTGSYGSGVGLGLGVNLGGGTKPRGVTRLSVRIRDRASATTLWEGRAEMIASADSPYADPQASAEILAAALFRGFPGGNGETVTIRVEDLQGAP